MSWPAPSSVIASGLSASTETASTWSIGSSGVAVTLGLGLWLPGGVPVGGPAVEADGARAGELDAVAMVTDGWEVGWDVGSGAEVSTAWQPANVSARASRIAPGRRGTRSADARFTGEPYVLDGLPAHP